MKKTKKPFMLGEDVFIHKRAEFTRPMLCRLGNHVAIDSGFYCTTALKVGDYVHISPHVAVIGGKHASLTVGNFCFISVGSKIVCASEMFYGEGLIGPLIPEEFHDEVENDPVVFEDFSGVGANCVVLPGVTLGEGSVVGAGSLVLEDTEPWKIYMGTPAKSFTLRRKDKMLEYAERLGYVRPTV
jgi:galactoside O-acetyltransferase